MKQTISRRNNSSDRKNAAHERNDDAPHLKRIEEFFEVFGSNGPEDELWKMMKLALAADNDNSFPRDRSNMIFFYEHVVQLFNDIFLCMKERK